MITDARRSNVKAILGGIFAEQSFALRQLAFYVILFLIATKLLETPSIMSCYGYYSTIFHSSSLCVFNTDT